MRPQQQQFEPAERDPVAIRRTVIILILLMLVGGFFIVYKYKQKMREEYEEDKKGRPVMSLGSVSSKTNNKALSTDGNIYDFTLLEGKVTLITVISANMPEQSKLIVDEMKKAQAHVTEKNKELQLICISADPLSEVPIEELSNFAEEIGAVGENWYVLSSNSKQFGGYTKDVLKLGLISRVDKDTGEQILPDFLRIIDPDMRIRGEVDDYKFVFYHAIESETTKEIAQNPSLLENEEVKNNLYRYQNAVSFNREKLLKNIDYILEYEQTNVAALKEANRSNRYHFPLIVFGGFILFILIMGMRLKMQRKKEAKMNRKNK